jgi:hypothetical protein
MSIFGESNDCAISMAESFFAQSDGKLRLIDDAEGACIDLQNLEFIMYLLYLLRRERGCQSSHRLGLNQQASSIQLHPLSGDD